MKKYIYVALVIVLTVLLFKIFSNQATRDLALEKEIIAVLEQGAIEVDLSELTTVDWTKAALFPPYTYTEVIEETMNISFKGDDGQIDLFDCCFLLVLASDSEALRTVMLPMHYGMNGIRNQHVLVSEEN